MIPEFDAYAEALESTKKDLPPREVHCVTCNKCGWVHFKVTRDYAEKEVAAFNAFFDRANDETRQMYGSRKSEIKNYEHCFRCGNTYKDFRQTQEGDCPIGCTLQPIIQDSCS